MINNTSKISHKGTTFGSDFDLLAPISTLITDLLDESGNLADKKNKVKGKLKKYFSPLPLRHGRCPLKKSAFFAIVHPCNRKRRWPIRP
jgi:hypothetical protein